MKRLYIIAATWPYGLRNDFSLDYEINQLKKLYSITVFSNAPEGNYEKYKGEIDISGVNVIRTGVIIHKIQLLFFLLPFLFNNMCRKEVAYIMRSKEVLLVKLKQIAFSLLFYSQAIYFKKRIAQEIKKEGTIYSYWNDAYVMGALLLKKEIKRINVVSRIHGCDLYNEGYAAGRQPFKWWIDEFTDKILFVSEAGRRYYLNNFCRGKIISNNKYVVSRLGQKRREIPVLNKGKDSFTLLSVSNVIPIKRLDLIIDALSMIDSVNIRWIHFGDGESFEIIKSLAYSKLYDKANIEYKFSGSVENEEILEFYESHWVDAFITTSSTEGLPVSVMEAMMYGIPVIATSVGGIPEMFYDDELLLTSDPSPHEVAEKVEMVMNMTDDRIQKIRRNNRLIWEEKFDLDKNTELLIKEVLGLEL